MPSCPWRAVSPLPNISSGASSSFLRPWNLQCLTLFTLRLLPARTETVLSQHVLREKRKTFFQQTLLVPKNTTTAHQPPYITSPQWRPSGTGNSLLCIAVLLCRSISALQRGTRPGLSSLSPDRGAMHTLSRGVVLTFEAEMGGIITALSAWHTWTRTASSPSPPAGAPRSTELFYWRKVAEWHLRVAASMRLRLVHERRRMGGMRASCRQGE